ncbi:MAG TPA: tetratricopeptide repeat protein [Thermoanaerobaculia bacterium]|nr:tetratricopeptide repeat protein [Thermoanaerobaculia bacterium]
MKRILLTAAVVALAGCSLVRHHNRSSNPYENPFYGQFLNTGSGLDVQIRNTVSALREHPQSAPLHNQLGQLLVQKGFPKDAEREFERAINADSNFYQAWYNLGLIRASHADYSGAERAFHRTVRLAKGHSEALFQLGLIEEKRGNDDAAIDYYAKALRHNSAILDVRENPQVLDSKLMPLALIRNYEIQHARQAGRYLDTPLGYVAPAMQEKAPSPQPTPQQIVPPAAPATDSSKQPSLPKTTT